MGEGRKIDKGEFVALNNGHVDTVMRSFAKSRRIMRGTIKQFIPLRHSTRGASCHTHIMSPMAVLICDARCDTRGS